MAENSILYWGSGSPPCWRIMIALQEKKLHSMPQKLLSFDKQEHKLPEVLAINPRGQLPSFKHEGNVVNESLAACMYLESQFKSQGNPLIPDPPAEQALVYQRMFEVLTLHQKMADFAFYNWRVPEPERHEAALARNKSALTTEFTLWEGYLGKMGPRSYIAGKNFTMADVVLFPQLALCVRFGLSQKRYPCLLDYYNRVKERPSIQATWPPHWRETPPTMDPLKDV
ncbi:glutathione S-transferase A-like [Scyliorhinus canicula]|uniref:glutathione S-transferase A-like n=1 Tax=Scyliorhinus canicula TaxID=7830 RepID=UPI0018F28531|nr:glutathione S-transferase A-like [Scyliorhinus canicula]